MADPRFIVLYKGLKIRSDMFPTPNQFREQNGMEPLCRFCAGRIRMMVMKGTGYCCENHREAGPWKDFKESINGQMLRDQTPTLKEKE